MRLGSILAACLAALFGGCQACSDCSDYAPPASFTAPGEMYSGAMLPAGPPVVPQVLPPGTTQVEPMPAVEEDDVPMARRNG
jgi:hypothetical protein